MEIYHVEISKLAEKDCRKVPHHVLIKLMAWVDDVMHRGLAEVRKVPGFHDEPLNGKRRGQRSIRLSKAYRAIYEIDKNNVMHFIEILRVNKHEY